MKRRRGPQPSSREMLLRVASAPRVFWFIDFDGTLVPIVRRPELVSFDDARRDVLSRLAGRRSMKVAVISGRPLSFLAPKIGLSRVTCAGNHGLEISGPGLRFLHPAARSSRPAVERVKRAWEETATTIPPGVWNEPVGIDITASGQIFTADRRLRRIEVLDPDGNSVRTFGIAIGIQDLDAAIP